MTNLYVWTSSAALCLLLTDPCSLTRVAPAERTASRLRMLGIPCGSDVTRSSTDGVCVSPGDVISYRAVASSASFMRKQDSCSILLTVRGLAIHINEQFTGL